jgi:uncharacterized protein (DUF1330 family)
VSIIRAEGGNDEKPLRHRIRLVDGAALGAAAVEVLHAQATPPVYMIAINEVTNPEGYKNEYLPPAQASIKAHGGVYIAAGTGTVIDGDLPKGRTVILRWDSMEKLMAWRHSPEYEAARKIGDKFAKYNLVAVEGVKP